MRSRFVGRRPLVLSGVAALATLALLVCISVQKAPKKRLIALEQEDYDDDDDVVSKTSHIRSSLSLQKCGVQ